MVSDRIEQSVGFKEFRQEIQKGAISHAYLFLGKDTMARELFAKSAAKVMLCPRGGCGICNVCKKIEENAHPDVEFLNADGKMKVKDVEEMTDRAYLKGVESEIKIFFLDKAETLSREVQNKMLKLYEEPPEGVVIVLLASGETGILHTVLSRANKRFVPRFSTAVVQNELMESGVEEQIANTAAVLSDGRFDLAFRFAEEEKVVFLYEEAFRVLSECKKTTDAVRFYRGKGFQKDTVGLTLDFMEIILSDVLTRLTGAQRPMRTVNRDYAIGTIANGFSPAGVAMALDATTKARNKLNVNVGVEAVAEQLLFDILEAKYKWQS